MCCLRLKHKAVIINTILKTYSLLFYISWEGRGCFILHLKGSYYLQFFFSLWHGVTSQNSSYICVVPKLEPELGL